MLSRVYFLSIISSLEHLVSYGFTVLAIRFFQVQEAGDIKVFGIIGCYTSILIFLQLPGGWLIDRLLGNKVGMLLGAFLISIAIGLATFYIDYIVLAFAIAAAGISIQGPSIKTLLADIHNKSNITRGFTIMYIFDALGIAIAYILLPKFILYYSITSGFYLILFSSIIAVVLTRIYINDSKLIKVYHLLSMLPMLLVGALLMLYYQLYNVIVIVMLLLTIFYFLYITYKRELKINTILYLSLIFLINTIFGIGVKQLGFGFLFFIDRNVKRVFDVMEEIPKEWFQAVNSIVVAVIGIFMITLWKKINKIKIANSDTSKMLFGLCMVAASFSFLSFISSTHHIDGKIEWEYVTIAIVVIAIAELFVHPVAYSAVLRKSPKKHRNLLLSVFKMNFAFGAYCAALFAQYFMSVSDPKSLVANIEIYSNGFSLLAQFIAVFVFIIVICKVLIAKIDFKFAK